MTFAREMPFRGDPRPSLDDIRAQNEATRKQLEAEAFDKWIPEVEAARLGYDYFLGDAARAFTQSALGELPWYLHPNEVYANTESGNFFDVTFRDGKAEDEQLRTAFVIMHKVINRFQRIQQKFQAAEHSGDRFPVEIVSEGTFFQAEGENIHLPAPVLRKLLEHMKSKDYRAFRQEVANVGAGYFHELIHTTSDDGVFDNNTAEELTMLGELLYDPLWNSFSNHEIYGPIGEQIFDEEGTRELGRWMERYHPVYRDLTSRLLLFELHTRGLIEAPQTADDAQDILANVFEYLALIPEEERDNIVFQYLPMKIDDLYARAQEITEKMQLPY